MQRWAMTGLGLTLGLLAVCGPTRGADAPAQPATADLSKAAELVKRLGDSSWEKRRDADKELALMGKAAEKVLRDNLTNSDLEISRRCERLLTLALRSETEIALDTFLQTHDDKLLLKLPSWERFSTMAGKDDAACRLFVDMYCSEGDLLEAAAKDPKNFATKFNTRSQQLQQMMWGNGWGGPQGNIGIGQIAALLFTATDPKINWDVNMFWQVSNLFYQPNIQQSFKNDSASRKVLVAFIEKRCDQNTLQNVMNIVLQMEIKEMVPLALKMSTTKDTQPYNKSMAMMIVGRLGTKEDAAKLEPMLTDKSDIGFGAMNMGNMTITTQIRDIALAAIVEANGESPVDFGFPYLQANPQVLRNPYFSPQWYGFAKDEDRDTAIKKWKAWQEKHDKKDKK